MHKTLKGKTRTSLIYIIRKNIGIDYNIKLKYSLPKYSVKKKKSRNKTWFQGKKIVDGETDNL